MTTDAAARPAARPPVSVVVPFLGGEAEARETFAALATLRLRPGDELIVADNGPGFVAAAAEPPPSVRVVRADGERSAYHARNRGAAAASNEWLLFLDRDCRPQAELLDRFFDPSPGDQDGAIAGRIETPAAVATLAGRWAAARQNVDQARNLSESAGAAATGSLLVRSAAWRDLGGFLEGIRSGGDLEFCWRLQDAGWAVGLRERAVVEHPPQPGLGGLLRQIARWAAGNAWQQRRRPGSSPRPPLAGPLARALVGALWFAVTLRLERARLKFVDGLVSVAREIGRLGSNASPRTDAVRDERPALAVFTDLFPAVSESFVATEAEALVAGGWRVRLEAGARPQRPQLGGADGWRVDYLEDAGRGERVAALGWLAVRHPLRAAGDLARRRRWPASERMTLRGIAPLVRRLARSGEVHVHAHFAGPGATHAIRAGRLAGVPVSIAVHGYDVYASPSALEEKLAAAAFVAAPCEYVRRDLQSMLGAPAAAKVGRVVMGVDGERFRRRSAPAEERTVAAVGRYVEKKGFDHLLAATAILRDRGEPARVVIAGEGPLRAELERAVAQLGLTGSVELPRADGPAAVRDLLERACVFAMPSVIASDGDRDSMPVVVKEALAMELPVVASDEVGLPEVVSSRWGRLVSPGDPEALAEALAELLALPAAERAAMGRAGRAFVLEHCDPVREAERLAALVRASASGGAGRRGRP